MGRRCGVSLDGSADNCGVGIGGQASGDHADPEVRAICAASRFAQLTPYHNDRGRRQSGMFRRSASHRENLAVDELVPNIASFLYAQVVLKRVVPLRRGHHTA